MKRIDAEALRNWVRDAPDDRRGPRVVVVAAVDRVAGCAREGSSPPWIAQVLPDYPANPAPVPGHPMSDSYEQNYNYVLQTERDAGQYLRDHPAAIFVMLATHGPSGFLMERVYGPFGEAEILDLVRGLPWHPLGNLPPALAAAAPPPPQQPPEPSKPAPAVPRSFGARLWRWFVTGTWKDDQSP